MMANSSLPLPNRPSPGPERISAHNLVDPLASHRVAVIDVREPREFTGGSIAGRLNLSLSRLTLAAVP